MKTLITVLVLIGVVFTGILFAVAKRPKVGAGPQRELILTLGWNGEQVKVPAPVEFPEWGRGTWDFKLWRWKKDARTFTTVDIEGYKYAAEGHGFRRNDKGDLYGAFGSIKRYRPDGVLEAKTTSLLSGNVPSEWVTLDENGNKTVRIYSHVKNGARRYEVTFFDAEGKMVKEWLTNMQGVVYSEQIKGENGSYHFTHQIKELADKEL